MLMFFLLLLFITQKIFSMDMDTKKDSCSKIFALIEGRKNLNCTQGYITYLCCNKDTTIDDEEYEKTICSRAKKTLEENITEQIKKADLDKNSLSCLVNKLTTPLQKNNNITKAILKKISSTDVEPLKQLTNQALENNQTVLEDIFKKATTLADPDDKSRFVKNFLETFIELHRKNTFNDIDLSAQLNNLYTTIQIKKTLKTELYRNFKRQLKKVSCDSIKRKSVKDNLYEKCKWLKELKPYKKMNFFNNFLWKTYYNISEATESMCISTGLVTICFLYLYTNIDS